MSGVCAHDDFPPHFALCSVPLLAVLSSLSRASDKKSQPHRLLTIFILVMRCLIFTFFFKKNIQPHSSPSFHVCMFFKLMLFSASEKVKAPLKGQRMAVLAHAGTCVSFH